jgi:hypothetical protein
MASVVLLGPDRIEDGILIEFDMVLVDFGLMVWKCVCG